MNRGCRLKNSYCENELSFVLKKENSKNVTFCLGCKWILSNAAMERLIINN